MDLELDEVGLKSSDLVVGKDEISIETVEKREENNGEMSLNGDSGVEGLGEASGSPSLSPPKVNGDAIGENLKSELSPNSVGLSSNSVIEVNSAPVKGFGLKKWRRIKRDLSKDGGEGGIENVASSYLIMKKRGSVDEPPSSKLKSHVESEFETPAAPIESLRSVEAVEEAVPLDPELVQLMAGGQFSIGVDSDNSEDRSSKSSMASTAFKARHEIGFGRERGRMKNVGGRGAGNAMLPRGQKGKSSGMDTNKKVRGDRVRLEKENSQSSVESDLRSSNLGYMRSGSGVSNGLQSRKSLSFDEEHDDEAQTSEEVRSGYYRENADVEDLLKKKSDRVHLEEFKMKRRNFRPPSGIDPFVESIVVLQAAQDALELEIQKIEEIGKQTELDEFGNLDDQSEEAEASGPPILKTSLLELCLKIEHLQNKLEESSASIKSKELKVLELEDIIKKETCCTELPDLNFDLEDLLKKKIQAEIEFLVITETTRSWKILSEEKIGLLAEQKSLAANQAEMLHKLKDAEDKAAKLKQQAEELESYCKLQNKVSKFSLCSFIQLLLLCVALGMYLMQLMPPPLEFVPT